MIRRLAYALALETLILSAYKLAMDITRWPLARQAIKASPAPE